MRAWLLLTILLAVPLLAQEADDGTIQVDVNVVNLAVTVTDNEGRFIVDAGGVLT